MELFYNLFSTFNKFARVEPFILLNNSPFLLATYLSPLKKINLLLVKKRNSKKELFIFDIIFTHNKNIFYSLSSI
jgi:hypothetical protein